MIEASRPSLAEIERQVCDIASDNLSIPRGEVHPESRLLEDLHADSLDLVELGVAIDERFGVSLGIDSGDIAFKAVFTRKPFRLRDLAEMVYLAWGIGAPPPPHAAVPGQRSTRWSSGTSRRSASGSSLKSSAVVSFTQLDGRWPGLAADRASGIPLFEPLGDEAGIALYRRRSDGMRCVLLPAATVELGSDVPGTQHDEGPPHRVALDPFLIDAEPVSTTAYCRFLNSIEGAGQTELNEWVLLPPEDDRRAQMVIEQVAGGWQPVAGTECRPMVLVSWFGAMAYALWANGRDWRAFSSPEAALHDWLPSEAQWEYAARGTDSHRKATATTDVIPADAQCGLHQSGRTYTAESMPLADVHAPLGLSPFGLHHMAGNVWQWCRDWYAPEFYRRPDALERNPVNRVPTGIRSERGGSWVGPADLCRGSYRRGRVPEARGRCLGFRCVGTAIGSSE